MAHEKFDGLQFEMDCMPPQRPQSSAQHLGLRRKPTFRSLFGAMPVINSATQNPGVQQPPAGPTVNPEKEELQFDMELDEPKAPNSNQASGAASSQESKENRLPPSYRSLETQVVVAAHRVSQVRGPNIQPLPAKSAAKAPLLALSTQHNIAQVSQLATSCTPSPGTGPRVKIGFTPRTSPSPKAQTPTSRSAAQSPAFMVKSPCMFRDSYPECDLPVVVGRPSDKSSCGIQLMERELAHRVAQPAQAATSSQKQESTQSSPVGSIEEFKFSI